MKKLLGASLLLMHVYGYGQVAINSNGSAPHASAMLDLQSTDKGMLVPRIALSAANVSTPVDAPADALLIYNTVSAGTGVNAVQPGFYHWDAASSRWMAMGQSSEDPGEGNTGFGLWNGCETNNISAFNPVAASDGMAGDYFGYSVSISGAYAIIGAPVASPGGVINAGVAYIFHFDGMQWHEQQKIVPVGATTEYYFGVTVAILGDHAIIGAPGPTSTTGAAEFYRLNGNTWEYQQTITANDLQNGDNFGSALSMSGNSVIIGANMADLPGINDAGAAYVFIFNGTTWIQQGKLTANDAAVGDLLGQSVSIFEDYAIAGAPYANPMGLGDAGAAYVFHFNGASWLQQQKLTASNPAASDNFGWSAGIHEEFAIVGAPYVNYVAPDTVADSGAAYVFRLLNNTWVEQQMLSASDRANVVGFGFSIAVHDTYAIITAPLDGSQQKALIFRNINGLWLEYENFTMPGGAYDDLFGYSASLDSDRFVIGAVRLAAFRGAATFGKID
jgi:hypothetical protein